MRLMWFHLMPYTELPDDFRQKHRSVWVDIHSSLFDPKRAHLMYNDFMDELEFAADCGFDAVCVNEHHSNGYGLMPSPNLIASSLARRTTNAAICVMGNSLALYNPPTRVAEEFAMIDVISGGRLIAGFPVGTPMDDCYAYGTNPSQLRDKYYEAHDLVMKAWTEPDTFAFNGRFNQQRYVNIWPRPVQQPHPPVWTTTGSTTQARLLGGKGYVMATLGSGYATRPLQDAYRAGYLAKWKKPAPPDRFAYLGLVAVADNEEEARRRGELIAGYLRSSAIVHVPFRNPPGFVTVDDNAKMLRGMSPPRSFTKDGRAISMHHGSVQDLIDAGILFCGTPDQVYEQIVNFTEYCGGMGNLLMMGHAGFLTHEDTVSNLELFAKHVMPRLKAYKQPEAEATAA